MSRVGRWLTLVSLLLVGGCSDDSDSRPGSGGSAGTAGGSSGSGGTGQAGSGQAGSGQAGSGQAGSGQAGTGTAGQAGGGAAGAGADCPLPASLGSPECDSCLATRCCASVDACLGSPECEQTVVCIGGCSAQPDPGACAADCFGAGPPNDGFLAIQDCLVAECESSCTS